ncbi:MAG: EAL domain-containing protein [Actinomycetes bacterium]
MRAPGWSWKWWPWVLALLVLCVGCGVTEWWARQDTGGRQSEARTQAESLGGQIRDRLESDAVPAYYTTHALDVYVDGENGILNPAEIKTFLPELASHGRFTRSVSLAPGNRIAYIAPAQTNKGMVGLYYPDLPEQWPAIQAMINGAPPALQGPYDLPQGGRGFTFRLPVTLPGSGYWGLASTVIDADAYLADASSPTSRLGVRSAVRQVSGDGSSGEAFWGDPSTFSSQPVLIAASPLGAQWQLGVVPNPIDAAPALRIRVVGSTLSVILAGLVFALVLTRQRRHELSRRLSQLSARAPGMFFQLRTHPDGTSSLPYVSSRVREMFGVDPSEVVHDADPMWNRVADTDIDRARASLEASAQAGRPWRERFQMTDVNGRLRWYLVDVTPDASEGDGLLWSGVLTDITDDVEVEEQLRIGASATASTPNGVAIMDPDGLVVQVNAAFSALTGYPLDEVRGRSLRMLGEGLTAPEVYEDLRSSLERTGSWGGELVNRTRSGQVVTQAVSVNPVRDDDGVVTHYVGVVSSLNMLREDVVTRLPSRQMFDDRLAQAVDRAKVAHGRVALLIVGIDHFRDVNESFGPRVGDIVLQEVARRVRAVVPPLEVVARFGGDEFAIVLTESADAPAVEQVAAAAMRSMAEPVRAASREIHLTASAGISVFPEDTDSADELVSNANQAMRFAKEHGRNKYHYFTASMQEQARERARLAEDLRVALAEGQLHLVLQPIVELSTGRIRKAEALLRWEHPERGLIPPMIFVPIAEQSDLIKDLGDFVFTETLAEVRRLREHDPAFAVSFNMSPLEVGDEGNLHELRLQQMKQERVPGSALVLEMTEGLMLDRTEAAISNMLHYRQSGMHFAIDDFGTGYSSLSYLQQLDADYLKIDRAFVIDLGHDHGSLALCEAMIDMAHKLDLKVIAEGVENQVQCDLLTAANCDYGQGYLFSRPIPVQDLIELLQRQNG